MRKFITILTTAALLCNLPVPELTVQAETLSGKCGYNVTYTVADGVLTLTGTGATYDFERIDGESAEAEWQGEGFRNGRRNVLFTAGEPGLSVFTFRNSRNSQRFNVLILVV